MEVIGDGISLSVVKQPEEDAENSVIVRVYNASENNTDGKVVFDRDVKCVYETNLNEEIRGEVKTDKNGFAISLSPWKIATYKVVFC